MFESARIKLTAWYLLIIMLISGFFSVAIYRVLTFELNRMERTHRLRIEYRLPEQFRNMPPSAMENELPRPLILDPNLIAETKNRLRLILIVINLVILVTSALAGYFLAGKTLQPISEMVDEQNRFVADASHELRTPLTALKSEIEVNLRDKKLTLAQAKRLLKSNLEEVNSLQRLSNYLLSLSQHQSDNLKISFEKLDLKEISKKAIAKLSPLAKAKKISIQKKLESVKIKGDEVSLIGLVIILLDNAIKYSHKGGKVIIKTRQEGKKAILEVQDFGIGIKSSELPHIFSRFYRADSSRSKIRINGYGLGLSIAKSIAELHQGKIEVESKIGKGSLFKLFLRIH